MIRFGFSVSPNLFRIISSFNNRKLDQFYNTKIPFNIHANPNNYISNNNNYQNNIASITLNTYRHNNRVPTNSSNCNCRNPNTCEVEGNCKMKDVV
uniref:Uncharacterized protein n=1 Tax=Octopus bimaculoides TaxID=37653 RepID=A0A0L8H678_OCTBM